MFSRFPLPCAIKFCATKRQPLQQAVFLHINYTYRKHFIRFVTYIGEAVLHPKMPYRRTKVKELPHKLCHMGSNSGSSGTKSNKLSHWYIKAAFRVRTGKVDMAVAEAEGRALAAGRDLAADMVLAEVVAGRVSVEGRDSAADMVLVTDNGNCRLNVCPSSLAEMNRTLMHLLSSPE